MNYKKIFFSFLLIIPLLFLSYGIVFALEVDWPTIGDLSIKSDSGTGDVARYFLALATAAGSVIMFGMIVKGGFDFMNASGNLEKISRAKTQMIGSSIGMIILLGVFIILNNINSELVSPENVNTECVTGIKRKITTSYKDERGKDRENIANLCYNTDQPDLTKDNKGTNTKYEDLGASYPPCSLREVITFSEKDYKGIRTVIFKDNGANDDNCPSAEEINKIRLGDAKSVKIILKKNGVYLYGKSDSLPRCGGNHLTKNKYPDSLCASGNVADLKEENGQRKWKCVLKGGDGADDKEISCWTKGKTFTPVEGCTPKSLKVSSDWGKYVDAQYETHLLGRVEFNWDGVKKVEISSQEFTKRDIKADDSLIIKNVTDPSNVLEKEYKAPIRAIWEGSPEIMDLLRTGSNTLEFYAHDIYATHISCTQIYLYWCEDLPPVEEDDDLDDEDEYPTEQMEASEELGPVYYSDGVENFSETNFNDKAQLIEIVNKGMITNGKPFGDMDMDHGEFYGAVLFSEAGYRGKCFYKNSSNLMDETNSPSLVVEKDFATGKKVDLRGNLSSMIVLKSHLTRFSDKSKGTIELFAVPNCGEVEKSSSEDSNKYDVCTIPIDPGMNGFQNLEKIFFEQVNNSACIDNFKDHSEGHYPIQSFRINGSAGVVLKSDAGNCHYFDVTTNERRGNCFTNLQDAFKTSLGQEKIKTIMVIPLEK